MTDPPTPTLSFAGVSKWYGDTVAVADVLAGAIVARTRSAVDAVRADGGSLDARRQDLKHAARGLVEAETRVRRRELADALASWAASYSELPAAPNPARARLSPRAAIETLAVVPPEQRRPGNITVSLNRLVEFPQFAAAIDLVDFGGDLEPAMRPNIQVSGLRSDGKG